MNRFSIFVVALAASYVLAQQDSNPNKSNPSPAPPNQSSPAQSSPAPAAGASSDDAESSSRDTRIDTAPPKDDAKNHPNSEQAVSDLAAPPASNSDPASDVQEFHPWNPYKANKDIQVGDFYFRRKNYKGALERYKEALYYKQNDAVATFRLGECEEKLGNKEEAKKYFEQYLKILPEGPMAKEAHNSIAKLDKNH
ncbi:MAG: tetratricopeptide repeat protein [Terriglobales bacterium]